MNSDSRIQDVYSLTPMQEGMLFHSIHDPDSSVYHELVSLRLRGSVDVKAMEQSLADMVQRHDVLRTVFVHRNLDLPRQVVLRERKPDFTYVDLRHFASPREKSAYVADYKARDRRRTFDLSRDMLLRLALLQTEDEEFEFYMLHHHIILDGWSTGIFFHELFEAYRAHGQGRTAALPPAPSFGRYVAWLRGRDKEESLAYWERQLAGYDAAPPIPGRRADAGEARPANQATLTLTIDGEILEALKRAAAASEVTAFTVLKALWGLLLARISDCHDVVFGTVVSVRPPQVEGIERMVGLFINTVPVRIRLSDDESCLDLIQRVQREALAAAPHQTPSLAEIQSRSRLKRNLFDHLLVFENYPIDRQRITEENRHQVLDMEVFEQANYALSVIIVPGAQMTVHFVYEQNVYEPALMSSLCDGYRSLIEQFARAPKFRVGDAVILPEAARHQIAECRNATAHVLTGPLTLHGLFERWVTETPDAPAVVAGGRALSYGELGEMAERVAAYLAGSGTARGTAVGVMMDQNLELPAALLGVLKAGCAYVPIDPTYPARRVAQIIADSGIDTVLVDALDPLLPENLRQVEVAEALASESSPPQGTVEPDDRAYVVFTSGSTGVPKGVAINHRAIVNTLQCRRSVYEMEPGCRALQLFSFAFDGFITGFFTPLAAGGTVVLAEESERRDPERVCRVLAEQQIEHLICIPTFFQEVVETLSAAQAESLETVVLAGEAADLRVIRKLRAINPSVEVAVEYGVTEAAVMSTIFRHQEKDDVLKIGRPAWNTEIYVLDAHRRVVPDGVPGEIYIGGAGVALGYLNRPELAEQRFVPHPLGREGRVYATGDVACWTGDGNLAFLGRKDDQVKIRGYRVETREIVLALEEHPAVRQAAVVDKTDAGEKKVLCAYLVTNHDLTTHELREYLLARLPFYMVPHRFVRLPSLPVNANGKLDAAALRQRIDELASAAEYVGPRTEVETLLVGIWQQVLGVPRVGIRDNFFDLGGDSIKSIQVRSRLGKAGYQVELAYLFQHPTIEDLAPRVTSARSVEEGRRDVHAPLPLLPTQSRYLTTTGGDLGEPTLSAAFVFPARAEEGRLEAIIDAVWRHHEALQARLVLGSGLPQQLLDPEESPLEASVAKEERDLLDPHLHRAWALQGASRIDSRQGRLIHAAISHSTTRSALVLTAHRALLDVPSVKVLFEDIGILWHQSGQGTPLRLPPQACAFSQVVERFAKATEAGSRLTPSAAGPSGTTARGIAARPQDLRRETLELPAADASGLLRAGGSVDTDLEDLLLTITLLAVEGAFCEREPELRLEASARGEIYEGCDNRRLVGNFQTCYALRFPPITTDDPGERVRRVREARRSVPRAGYEWMTEARGVSARAPRYGFRSSLLDWAQAEHLDCFVVCDTARDHAWEMPGTPLVFDWTAGRGQSLRLELLFDPQEFAAGQIGRLLTVVGEGAAGLVRCYAERAEQQAGMREFTFKDVSPTALDAFESFFNSR